MNWVILLSLIGGCLAKPLQQGNLKLYRYTTNREGQDNQGIPVAPQPIVYNPQQPFIIEPSPLTYSSVRGSSILNERDEQRHINVDEEIEARDESPEDQSRPVEDVRVDSDAEGKEDSGVGGRVDDQRPVQTETAANLGSSVLNVKGGQIGQPMSIDQDQLFQPVISGQRRLVEPQPQSLYYGLQSIPGQTMSGFYGPYQPVRHQVPISIEEQRINQQRPVIQYQTNPVQNNQAFIPREWVRQPVQQIQSGVKGGQKQIQWFIQPIIPSDINLDSRGSGGEIGSQQLQRVGVQQVQPQIVTIPVGLQGIKIQQRGQAVQEDVKEKTDVQGKGQEPGDAAPLSQPETVQQDVDLRPLQVVQQQQRPELLSQQQGVKSSHGQPVSRVVVQTTSQRHVPVVNDQRFVSYQFTGQQPQQFVVQQQQPVHQQVVSHIGQQPIGSSYGHQNIRYSTIPISDLQQYYQIVQSIPVQQPNHQYIGYNIQNPSYVQQPIQPFQYSSQLGQVDQVQGVQQVGQVGQGIQGLSVDGVQGVKSVQRVNELPKGQDLRVNPLSVDQRQQRSFVGRSGVKGAVNV